MSGDQKEDFNILSLIVFNFETMWIDKYHNKYKRKYYKKERKEK